MSASGVPIANPITQVSNDMDIIDRNKGRCVIMENALRILSNVQTVLSVSRS